MTENGRTLKGLGRFLCLVRQQTECWMLQFGHIHFQKFDLGAHHPGRAADGAGVELDRTARAGPV